LRSKSIKLSSIIWTYTKVNLPFYQFAPKVFMRSDDTSSLPNIISGFLSTPSLLLHQKCYHQSRRPGYSSLTVYKRICSLQVISDETVCVFESWEEFNFFIILQIYLLSVHDVGLIQLVLNIILRVCLVVECSEDAVDVFFSQSWGILEKCDGSKIEVSLFRSILEDGENVIKIKTSLHYYNSIQRNMNWPLLTLFQPSAISITIIALQLKWKNFALLLTF